MTSDRQTASHQKRHQNKAEIILAHHLVFFILVRAAIGDGFTDDMIRRGTCRFMSSSFVRIKKVQPCFYPRMQKHQLGMPHLPGDRRLLTVAVDANDVEAHAPSPTFYQRLNSPKHILAPMVAQSDLPFRLMCEQLYNVDLSYTQMIHAVNFVATHGETFRANHLDVYPQSIVRDILLGRGDRSALLMSSSQVNAIEGLCHNDIEQSRQRILNAISKDKGGIVLSESAIEVKPTVVQIATHDPDVAVKAANMILEMSGSMDSLKKGGVCPVAAIDLNLGCPQGIARKGRYGSFLHDEFPGLTYNVLAKLRSKVPRQIGKHMPNLGNAFEYAMSSRIFIWSISSAVFNIGITAKIRLPPNKSDADSGRLGGLDNSPQTIDERMRCLIDCGVDLITVHGRTRFENKITVGPADWTSVRQCVETARACSGDAHYPIFANGGVEFCEDVQKCLDGTNASGVMASESLLEVPGLFCPEEAQATARGLLERQLQYAEIYLDYATLFPPLPGSLGIKGGSFNVIRSHLFKILHRYLEEQPDLRSLLGDHRMNTIKQSRSLVYDLRSRYDEFSEEKLRLMKSWSQDSSWYRRHRQNCSSQNESIPSLSIEERKQRVRLKIRRMQEERGKSAMDSVLKPL